MSSSLASTPVPLDRKSLERELRSWLSWIVVVAAGVALLAGVGAAALPDWSDRLNSIGTALITGSVLLVTPHFLRPALDKIRNIAQRPALTVPISIYILVAIVIATATAVVLKSQKHYLAAALIGGVLAATVLLASFGLFALLITSQVGLLSDSTVARYAAALRTGRDRDWLVVIAGLWFIAGSAVEWLAPFLS